MNIDIKYKWLARDKNGNLFAFENKPTKLKILWKDQKMPELSIEEKDERFSFINWHDDNPVYISDIGNILKDGKIDSNDIISKPSHYIGINGLEVEQILAEFLPRFTDGYEAHRVGSAIEYLLRSPLKNGDEDIKKAGQNIEQIKKYKQSKKRQLRTRHNREMANEHIPETLANTKSTTAKKRRTTNLGDI